MYYYDNIEVQPDIHGNVDIDRVYCLDFHQFDEATWQRLSAVYRLLPKPIIKDGTTQSMWFGEEDASEYYLWASVEPSGLQIAGYLKMSDWQAWEQIFQKHLTQFPLFSV